MLISINFNLQEISKHSFSITILHDSAIGCFCQRICFCRCKMVPLLPLLFVAASSLRDYFKMWNDSLAGCRSFASQRSSMMCWVWCETHGKMRCGVCNVCVYGSSTNHLIGKEKRKKLDPLSRPLMWSLMIRSKNKMPAILKSNDPTFS